MKLRPKGFLADEVISHESEQFDYITELHEYLWAFIRNEIPGAEGKLGEHLDAALEISTSKQHPFIPYTEETTLAPGVYEVKTSNGTIGKVEMAQGGWFPMHQNQAGLDVVGYRELK